MKRIKTLLVMCGMVVVLAGLLVLVRNLAGEKEGSDTSDTGSADTTYTAAQVDIDSLYLIEYNIGQDKYRFELSDSKTKWLWEAEPSLPLDNTYFASMASALRVVTSSVKLEADESSLSAWELDNPWLSVTVADELFGEQTFMFGSLNSYTGRYYFITGAGDGFAYMVNTSVAQMFDLTPYDMVMHDKLPDIPADRLRTLSFSRAGDELKYTYYEAGKDDSADTDDLWYVSENGGEETALDPEIAADIADAINRISFTDIAGYSEAEKEVLGLLSPTVMTVEYVAETSVTDSSGSPVKVNVDSSFVLYLGYADDEGNICACLPNSPLSYRIDGSVLAKLFDFPVTPVGQ
jgi:hypothetical protein